MGTMHPLATILSCAALALPLTATTFAEASDAPPPPRIQVGQPFPDLRFPALADGKLTSISAFRGKKTIVHIFASW